MFIYHAWFNLKAGTQDLVFAAAVHRFLGPLVADQRIGGWRLMRRALGLGPADVGEFHLMIEIADLAALDGLFREMSAREEPMESLHHGVNSLVTGVRFALYRDFPDPWRRHGAEKF